MCDLCLPSRRQVLLGLAGLPFVGLPTAAAVAPGLTIHPRSDWAGTDRAPTGPIVAEEVRFLLVHHTAGNTEYGEDEVPQLIRNIHAFHTGPEKGWSDVAYNFLIDRYGGVWEARAGALEGAVRGDATGGNQGFSQLVCVMGTFASQLPTELALASLVSTLAWLADRHGLDTSPGASTSFESLGSNRHTFGTAVTTPVITGHRSMSQTSCPGDALFGYVSRGLMADVTAARLGQPSTSATSAPGTTAASPSATNATSSATNPADTVRTEASNNTVMSGTSPTVGSTQTAAPVSTTGDGTDTVDDVAGSVLTPQRAPSPQRSLPAEGARDSSAGLTGWQGVTLAGAGAAAATAGMMALRRRDNRSLDESDRA